MPKLKVPNGESRPETVPGKTVLVPVNKTKLRRLSDANADFASRAGIIAPTGQAKLPKQASNGLNDNLTFLEVFGEESFEVSCPTAFLEASTSRSVPPLYPAQAFPGFLRSSVLAEYTSLTEALALGEEREDSANEGEADEEELARDIAEGK